MTTEPVTDEEDDGSKVTVMVQLAPAATDVQLLEGGMLVKLGLPVAVTEVTAKMALPVLVKVTVLTFLEPMAAVPKSRLAGDSVTTGIEVPVPARAAKFGLPVPLDVTEMAAASLPANEGLKVTVMVQLAFVARLAAHVLV